MLTRGKITTRLNWALRNSALKSEPVPENLDWTSEAPRIAVDQCALPLIVGERHHTLNWLTQFGDDDWDDTA